MYSKAEATIIRQQFWTAFGKYMAPLPSASGEKINWVNYKTGVKNIFFRLEAGNRKAYVQIDIQHKDDDIRKRHYGLLQSFHQKLDPTNEWTWLQETIDEHGRKKSSVQKEIHPVNVFIQDDWPQIISFFKVNIIKLDAFWVEHRQIVEML